MLPEHCAGEDVGSGLNKYSMTCLGTWLFPVSFWSPNGVSDKVFVFLAKENSETQVGFRTS